MSFDCGVVDFVLTGAGIYVTNSQLSYSSSSLPNNSIIASYAGFVGYRYRDQMEFYCCSNSTTSGSTFIGLNGNPYSGRISIERYSSSSSYTGCMRLYLYGRHGLSTSEQGIYTCRMPDSTGRNINVSVGIYNRDYTSEFILLYILVSIKNWYTSMLRFNLQV